MALSPIDALTNVITDRQTAISFYIIQKIVKRIKEIGSLLPSDLYALKRLVETGSDLKDINKKIAEMTKLQEKDIKKLIEMSAKESYMSTKDYYEYRNMSFIPFEKNTEVQRVVKSVQKITTGTYKNLSQSTGFMIRDRKNPKRLKPTSVAKTYQSIIDEAVQASQSGVIDYHTAIRRTIKQLSDSGLRYVTYDPESGRSYSVKLDTAVRRNILDGIRSVNQGVQDETGKQYGADGKEITVHQYPAPDHQPIQGHQFTNEEYEKLQSEKAFEDVNHRKFAPIKRKIGTWNCRHFTYSIIVGVNKPNYTQEQLNEMEKKNQKGYTAPNGKHMTMYECTQEQRAKEREIRRLKEQYVALRDSGDSEGSKSVKAKISQNVKEYQSFSNACGISPKPENLRVNGY